MISIKKKMASSLLSSAFYKLKLGIWFTGIWKTLTQMPWHRSARAGTDPDKPKLWPPWYRRDGTIMIVPIF